MDEYYGKEYILDLHHIDVSQLTKASITEFCKNLCDLIHMKRYMLHIWDDADIPVSERFTEPHLVGISACQFIYTSSITIHASEPLKKIFINVFSCKEYSSFLVKSYALLFFKGKIAAEREIYRF